MHKCSKFGCKNRFNAWDAVEYHYCGELHRTCSYTCLHYVKQAVTCRITEQHRAMVKTIVNPKYRDLTKVWRK